MKRTIQKLLVFSVIVLLFSHCSKKAFDEYYARPDTLEQPIYQQLAAKGNFKNFLALVDKAGYKQILSGAGYWTVFAPHDSAFQVYFAANNISGIDRIDSSGARKIVTYALVYNAFKKERIGDYQSNIGWVPNLGFRRRTANYLGVYDGTSTAGAPLKVINSNRNNNGTQFYAEADNNAKHVTYFVDNFMASKGLTAADYNYFYPNSTYVGFNLFEAKVVERDIAAENGVIHVTDRVINVLPGLDEYISSRPEYSEFKRLFDRFLVQYALNPTVTQNFQNVTGSSAQVFTKVFNAALAFSPNNENFLKFQDNDGQQDCYSMFVPRNAELLQYINTVLLEKYPSIDALPINIVLDFVNAHLWRTAVWPSKFRTTFNFLGEEARFDPVTNVIDRKILSNGIFYGTNKVQEANVFSSVYGRPYLDPNYSMMTSLLNQELKIPLSNLNQKYTLLLVSNAALIAAGYTNDPTIDINPNFQWRYVPPGGGATLTGSSALVRLLRVIYQHVIPEVDITSLQPSGVAQTYAGEFIRFNNNTVVAAGNVDGNTLSRRTDTRFSANGSVHYVDRVLDFTELPIGRHIERLGTPTTSEFNFFWQYLRNSSIYVSATADIIGVAPGTFYTCFIPNNAAIRAAVNDGRLPGTGTAPNRLPNFNPTSPAERELVNKFIYYHFLNKKTVATNGRESGSYETLQRRNNGDPTSIFVDNAVVNAMTLRDMENRNATVLVPSSNVLSNRCVIHLINNYLRYIE